MIRMSMLRNMPVVFGQKQIGLLQDACFDQTRKRVCAFVVSCGMRGKKMVPAQHVCMMNERFVLVDGLAKFRSSERQRPASFVRDSSGILVGRVTDYAVDRKSLEVLALQIITGYSRKEIRSRIWVYAYIADQKSDDLIIPADLCNQPCLFKEENNPCECPP